MRVVLGENLPQSQFVQFFYGSAVLVGLGRFCFSSLIYTPSVRLLGRVISPSQGRYLQTGQNKQNNLTQTSHPLVVFEPTIPAFEQVKTLHASDRAVTVIGQFVHYEPQIT
jgi:hypothetical protein